MPEFYSPRQPEKPKGDRRLSDAQVLTEVKKVMRKQLDLNLTRNQVVHELESREPYIRDLIGALKGRENASYTPEKAREIQEEQYPEFTLADLEAYHRIWEEEIERLRDEDKQFKRDFKI